MDRFEYNIDLLKRLSISGIEKNGFIKISSSSEEDIRYLDSALLELRFYGYITDIKGHLRDRWVRPTKKFIREYNPVINKD